MSRATFDALWIAVLATVYGVCQAETRPHGPSPVQERTQPIRVESVRALAKALQSPDVAVRAKAAEAITSLGPRGVAPLINVLNDPDLRTSWIAAAALKRTSGLGTKHVGCLSQALRSGRGHVRIHAAEVLGSMGPTGESAAEALVVAMDRADVPLTKAAAAALARMGPAGARSLARCLENPGGVVRLAAVTALKTQGPIARTAVPALARALEDRDVKVRDEAAWALASVGPGAHGATGALVSALEKREYVLFAAAAMALKNVGPAAKPAVPALLEALRSGTPAEYTAPPLAAIDPGTVHILIRWSKDADELVRDRAVRALAAFRFDTDLAVPALVSALRDKDHSVRQTAVSVLRHLGPGAKAAVPAVARILGGTAPYSSVADREFDKLFLRGASSALGVIGPPALDAVTKVLKNGRLHWVHRLYAAKALGLMGPDAEGAVDALIGGLKDPSARVRRAAAEALRRIGPGAKAAVPALIASMQDAEKSVRLHAVDALGSIGPAAKPAVKALVRGLKESDSDPFDYACALGNIGPAAKEAAGALESLLDNERGWEYEAYALARVNPEGKRGIDYLVRFLRDPDWQTRGESARLLGKLGPQAKPAMPALAAALKDRVVPVRREAARALVLIGPRAKPAVAALIRALGDEDGIVRTKAAEALAAIGPAATRAIPALKAAAWFEPKNTSRDSDLIEGALRELERSDRQGKPTGDASGRLEPDQSCAPQNQPAT